MRYIEEIIEDVGKHKPLSYRDERLIAIAYIRGKYEGAKKNSDTAHDIEVLDRIRAEIMDTGAYEQEVHGKTEFLVGINYCLSVIDKYYSAKSEG